MEKEFLSNLLTSRFVIGFIICLLSTSIAVYVQVDDYEKRLQAYSTSVRKHKAEVDSWDIYGKVNPKVDRKPNQLSIFKQGIDKQNPDTVSIELSQIPWAGLTQKLGSDNPFLRIFLSIDLVLVFQIVISLLAVLFAYDAISGEKEDGTLCLMLSNTVPRDTILIGKYLGGVLSLLPTLMISLLVGLLIAQLSPYTSFSGMDMVRIVLILAVSLLYVSCCYLLGLFLSTMTKQAATTLILAMFIWVIFTIVYPNAAAFLVEKFPPYRFEDGLFQQAGQIWDDFKKERDNYLKAKGRSSPTEGIHGRSSRQSLSGGMHMKEVYVFSKISEDSDLSFFQEFLAYQEPLRIKCANKVGQILKGIDQFNKRMERLTRNVSRISFAGTYDCATSAIAGTDSDSYCDFIEQAREYRHEIIQYLTDKKAFSSRQWFASDKGKADFAGMPVFQQRREELRKSIRRALPDILILFSWNALFFMGAYISFRRYDVR